MTPRTHPGNRRPAAAVRTIATLAGFLAVGWATADAQTHAPACAPARTALVLGGGGARGFAHIGVFRVLDSLGVTPDFIVGTSAGAIAGALYASGYSGREIDSLIRTLPIREIIQLYEPRPPGVLSQFPALAVWENHGRGFQLQSGAVREGQFNAQINSLTLRGNLLARGDFDRLPIPLRVVATDLGTRSAITIGSGDLARAVRASAAIPLLFAPVDIDGRLLVDGGIADNTPVSIARAMGAERIIMSMLERPKADLTRLDDPIQSAMALGPMLFVDDTSGLAADDIRIVNPTVDVHWFSFEDAVIDSVVAAGIATARAAVAGKCIVTQSGSRRSVPANAMITGPVTIAGENPIERAALRTALGVRTGAVLSEDSLRTRLLRLGKSDALRAIWITPSGPDSAVQLDIRTVRTGRQVMTVGLAYDNDMGGRLWGGVADRRLFGWSLEGALSADVGKYRRELRAVLLQQVAFTGRAFPIYGALSLLDEDVRVFDDSVEFDPLTVEEFIVAGGVRPRLGDAWTVDLSAELRAWSDPGREQGEAAGVRLAASRASFGRRALLSLDVLANTAYARAALELAAPFSVRRIELEPRVRAGWGERLPVHQTFALGGSDGFAGFVIGERRGAHEAVASLSVARSVLGPVYVRAEGMAGALGNGARFLERARADSTSYFGQRVVGGRVGVEVRTPALDIRIEQGFNDLGRRHSFVRIGRWF